jgi:hypothetical protein
VAARLELFRKADNRCDPGIEDGFPLARIPLRVHVEHAYPAEAGKVLLRFPDYCRRVPDQPGHQRCVQPLRLLTVGSGAADHRCPRVTVSRGPLRWLMDDPATAAAVRAGTGSRRGGCLSVTKLLLMPQRAHRLDVPLQRNGLRTRRRLAPNVGRCTAPPRCDKANAKYSADRYFSAASQHEPNGHRPRGSRHRPRGSPANTPALSSAAELKCSAPLGLSGWPLSHLRLSS